MRGFESPGVLRKNESRRREAEDVDVTKMLASVANARTRNWRCAIINTDTIVVRNKITRKENQNTRSSKIKQVNIPHRAARALGAQKQQQTGARAVVHEERFPGAAYERCQCC
jgi:hypothetical protein